MEGTMSKEDIPSKERSRPVDRHGEPRLPWHPPEIEELPPLTDLTLQTGDPVSGGGDTGGGGSTVF